MDGAVTAEAYNLVGLAIATGTILWRIGNGEGKRKAVEEDHQRQLDRLVHESATKEETTLMMTAFQDEVGNLVRTVDTRMKSVEEMVGRRFTSCEMQIGELRSVMIRRPVENGGG